MKLKKENELKKNCESEGSKKDDEKESERKKERQKIMREKQKKKKTTEDVFPNDVPSGLPPIRGIEHQIDFVPSASIPNWPTYRSNMKETKFQRQVKELMAKGHVRESTSPCTVQVLLVPKKDGTWRMCVDCRAIKNEKLNDF